jgi:hypothetical protein
MASGPMRCGPSDKDPNVRCTYKEMEGDLACPTGIEPVTYSLEGCCSIQLSYGQKAWVYGRVQHPRNKLARDKALAK